PHHHLDPARFLATRPSPAVISTLALHDALPICDRHLSNETCRVIRVLPVPFGLSGIQHLLCPLHLFVTDGSLIRGILWRISYDRSEEHTSELQSRFDLVCRLLLEKKKYRARQRL